MGGTERLIQMCKKHSGRIIYLDGFAGPGISEDRKKVGLGFCGIVGPDDYRQVFEKNFIGSRSEIKFRTAQFVLNKLRIAVDNIIK